MPAQLAYVYGGELEGLFTAVFEAYRRREQPDIILPEGKLQTAFGQRVTTIAPDAEKARRVEAGVVSKLGQSAFQSVWTAYQSYDEEKDTKIYRYLRHGFALGRRFYSDLANDDVIAVNKLCKHVENEAHRYKQFARFSHTEGGVYYAKIAPLNNVLPMIMPHFADRYQIQPFVIHDTGRGLVGVYDLRGWQLAEVGDSLTVPEPSPDELHMRRLWKLFFDTVEIRERRNPRCQRNMSPKRYWTDMTEHNGAWLHRDRVPQDSRLREGKSVDIGN